MCEHLFCMMSPSGSSNAAAPGAKGHSAEEDAQGPQQEGAGQEDAGEH